MLIRSDSVGECVARAVEACATSPQMNLVLSTCIAAPFRDDFILTYLQDAVDWQSTKRPPHLKFNHGEYISRHGDALAFIEQELSGKSTSNRACVCLADSGEIMLSGDGPLPSLMFIQAGFQPASQETLYLTAYFRALEVQQFLPINFAELAFLADRLSKRFPTIASAEMTIFAFRAHLNRGFGTHRVALLDQASSDDIERAVRSAILTDEWGMIIEWLVEKKLRESVIDLRGLATLATALSSLHTTGVTGSSSRAKAPRVLAAVEGAVSALAQVEAARRNGTHGRTLESLQTAVESKLDYAIAILT